MIRKIQWTYVQRSSHDLIFIIGSGPSAKNVNFKALKEVGYCIAVNDVGHRFPSADAWFTLDPWGLHKQQLNDRFEGIPYAAVPDFYGTKYAISHDHKFMPKKKFNYLCRIPQNFDMRNTAAHKQWGLNEDPRCINSGNSGFGALNLAFHMRPKKIALIGIDCTQGYFFNEKYRTKPLDHVPFLFMSAVKQLKRENIETVDCSLFGNLKCFPKVSWEKVING